jgi:hypothetical protein
MFIDVVTIDVRKRYEGANWTRDGLSLTTLPPLASDES